VRESDGQVAATPVVVSEIRVLLPLPVPAVACSLRTRGPTSHCSGLADAVGIASVVSSVALREGDHHDGQIGVLRRPSDCSTFKSRLKFRGPYTRTRPDQRKRLFQLATRATLWIQFSVV